jgi:hypothetical protein
MTTAERQATVGQGVPPARWLRMEDLQDECLLQPSPQPLDFLRLVSPAAHLATAYTTGAKRLAADGTLQSSAWDARRVAEFNGWRSREDVPISQVLDWWPERVPMPPGYHVTATAMDLAPVTFDSHYAWDKDLRQLHYVHSGLRNASLLRSHLGAGGLCRAHSVGMPLFEANTNRYCTRAPKQHHADTPHLPVDLPWAVPRALTRAYMEAQYEPPRCASSAREVPWVGTKGKHDEAGELPTAAHDFAMDAFGTVVYKFPVYPVGSSTPMFPLRGLYKEWGRKCAGTVRWGASPPCRHAKTGEGRTMCPKNTACLPLNQGVSANGDDGLCFSIDAFRKDGARMPCFRCVSLLGAWGLFG